jgi:hypothetical protein
MQLAVDSNLKRLPGTRKAGLALVRGVAGVDLHLASRTPGRQNMRQGRCLHIGELCHHSRAVLRRLPHRMSEQFSSLPTDPSGLPTRTSFARAIKEARSTRSMVPSMHPSGSEGREPAVQKHWVKSENKFSSSDELITRLIRQSNEKTAGKKIPAAKGWD